MAGKKNEVKVRVPKNARFTRFFMGTPGKVLLASCVLLVTAGLIGFTYFYVQYSQLIDEKLRAGPFANTSKIYAAPELVGVGDKVSPDEVVQDLRRAGYSDSRGNPMGWFNIRSDAIEVFPGRDSYFREEAGVIKFAKRPHFANYLAPGQHGS